MSVPTSPAAVERPDVTRQIVLHKSYMDGLGHLNQARYHDLLGSARALLLMGTHAGKLPREGSRFVLARSELDYRHEVRLADGYVTVHARIERVGRKSVLIANEVVRPDGTVAASGSATMVAWDPHRRRARGLSDAERAAYGG
jgi:acyl-CoA thioester hydrolase